MSGKLQKALLLLLAAGLLFGAGMVQQSLNRDRDLLGLTRVQPLENAPPELSADLVETGIVLTGGSALLRNLDRFISSDCGLPVRVADDPLSSVIQGLARQLNGLRPREWRRFGNGR